MNTIQLKSWKQLIDYIKKTNAKVEVDKDENLKIHIGESQSESDIVEYFK